jgi:hypothetical protein
VVQERNGNIIGVDGMSLTRPALDLAEQAIHRCSGY